MKSLRKAMTNKYLLTAVGVLLFFLIWVVIYYLAGSNRIIFPEPIETFNEMFIYLKDSYTYLCIWESLKRMLIGFVTASVLAIVLGIVVGNYSSLKYVFNPTMVAIKAVPTAALVFLFLMLTGLKNAPIYIVGVIVFPIVYEATIAGYSSIDEFVIMSSRIDGANKFRSNAFIKFPLALPTIILGLVSSFALSFKIEIMAEVISGSTADGIGIAIRSAYINSDKGMVPTFAYSLIAIIVMLLVTLILDLLKKLIKTTHK